MIVYSLSDRSFVRAALAPTTEQSKRSKKTVAMPRLNNGLSQKQESVNRRAIATAMKELGRDATEFFATFRQPTIKTAEPRALPHYAEPAQRMFPAADEKT